MAYHIVVVLFVVVKLCGLAYADCYPGDTQYTAIVQELYKSVTSDRINLRGYLHSLTRQQLCKLLVNNHNTGYLPISGQTYTNKRYLGQSISESTCVNALTYTKGYDTQDGWKKWAGNHHGTWWSRHGGTSFADGATWYQPYLKYDRGQTYAVQKVKFHSKWRKKHCKHVDQTGSTCQFGWHQSGNGIKYVWGWDRKNNDCPQGNSRGRTGTHVGFTFNEGIASCIIWIASDEAFLDCVNSGNVRQYPGIIFRIKRRSSCNHDGGGYGQWRINRL